MEVHWSEGTCHAGLSEVPIRLGNHQRAASFNFAYLLTIFDFSNIFPQLFFYSSLIRATQFVSTTTTSLPYVYSCTRKVNVVVIFSPLQTGPDMPIPCTPWSDTDAREMMASTKSGTNLRLGSKSPTIRVLTVTLILNPE